MKKSDWRKSCQCIRIQEILEDYWLSQPDERQVTVCMTFVNQDGQTQSKRIIWTNPKYRKDSKQAVRLQKLSDVKAPECGCVCMEECCRASPE